MLGKLESRGNYKEARKLKSVLNGPLVEGDIV